MAWPHNDNLLVSLPPLTCDRDGSAATKCVRKEHGINLLPVKRLEKAHWLRNDSAYEEG